MEENHQPGQSERVEINLRIPNKTMAEQIADKTIQLLQATIDNEATTDQDRRQCIQCIELIRRGNPHLQFEVRV